MNNVDTMLDKIIFTVYTNQFQNDESNTVVPSETDQKLFEHFIEDANGSVEEVVQKIYALTSEKFFALGFKAALNINEAPNCE